MLQKDTRKYISTIIGIIVGALCYIAIFPYVGMGHYYGYMNPTTKLSSSPFKASYTYNFTFSDSTSHFQDEPTYRGTVGLITTCLSTLGLCVWTALHLNLSESESIDIKSSGSKPEWWRRKAAKSFKRFQWILVGIFIQELIAFMAWTQFLSASSFNKEMLEVLGQEDKASTSPKRLKHQIRVFFS